MPSQVLFMYPPGKPTEALYEDDVDFTVFGDIDIVRNSHVEPTDNGPNWEIRWEPEFFPKFGKITTRDEQGNLFKSHAAAVACEKRMLLKHHYNM